MVAGGSQQVLDGPRLCLLSRQLIFFYRQNVDVHRLVRIYSFINTHVFDCSIGAIGLGEFFFFEFCMLFLCLLIDMVVPEPGET